MTIRSKDFLAIGRAAAQCGSDKKALDVTLMDVRRFSSLADYYLVASTESNTHLRAVQEHIAEKIKERFGLDPLRGDGYHSSQWTVLDYGGLVVHLMHSKAREFYGLERLWDGARVLDWELSDSARAMPAPPSSGGRDKNRRAESAPAHSGPAGVSGSRSLRCGTSSRTVRKRKRLRLKKARQP